MFDKDTLIISYNENIGEPRGGRKRGSDYKAAGLGTCVDCNKCVQVCPTGIDIRKGLQYECIACAACIDACNEVMDRLEYPRDLISYTTDNAAHGKKTRVLRPRIMVYMALLTVLFTLLGMSLANRTPLIVDVIRDRNSLFREIGSEIIENSYTLKIINQSNVSQDFRVSVSGLENAELNGMPELIHVEGGEVLSLPTRVRVPRSDSNGVSNITFTVESVTQSDLSITEKSRFLAPSQ
jgi:cytochrome c oxidase accessory protein FixG